MIINDLYNNKKQSVAEGSIATVGWPDEGNHSGNNPTVSISSTVPARPVVKQGSLVKASGLTGVYRVMDIRRDQAKIVQEIPNTGQSTYVPMSDLRVWTNKPIREQGMAEGKRADTYHIVNKDGKPANLASYADKESAVKDRDAKHQGAEVRQLGPRGKVKSVSEVSLGDYRKKAAVSQAGAKIDRFFGRDDAAKVAAADQTIAKREKGLARADARIKPYTPPPAAPADLEKQRRDLTAKYPNIDELVRRAELNRDPNYEMADGQAYYAARDAEQNYQKLKQIQRVIQGLNESQADTKKKELGTGTGRINPDTGRPWTPSELKAKYANVDFDQDIRRAELKRLSDLAKQEKLKDRIKASLDDPRDTARDLAKSLINKGGLGSDFKTPSPVPPGPTTVQAQPPGFDASNLAQQPGMTPYMQQKPAAPSSTPVAKKEPIFINGTKVLPSDPLYDKIMKNAPTTSESLTWSPNFNPGRSLYHRMKQDI